MDVGISARTSEPCFISFVVEAKTKVRTDAGNGSRNCVYDQAKLVLSVPVYLICPLALADVGDHRE